MSFCLSLALSANARRMRTLNESYFRQIWVIFLFIFGVFRPNPVTSILSIDSSPFISCLKTSIFLSKITSKVGYPRSIVQKTTFATFGLAHVGFLASFLYSKESSRSSNKGLLPPSSSSPSSFFIRLFSEISSKSLGSSLTMNYWMLVTERDAHSKIEKKY